MLKGGKTMKIELAELRRILELSDDVSLKEHITKIKTNIDKT